MRKSLCCICLLLMQFATYAQSQDTDLYNQTSEVNNIMVQYYADRGALNRFYFVRNSPERREKMTALQEQYLQRLSKLDYAKLPVGSAVDYVLFRRDLKDEQFQLDQEAKEYKGVQQWFPFAERLYAVERLRRRGAAPDAEKLAAELNTLVKDVIAAKVLLKKDSSLPLPLSRRAAGVAKGMQSAIKSTFDFYNGYDPLFTWWIPAPYKRLDSLLNDYANILTSKGKNAVSQKDDGSGIIGNPIGREELIRQLQEEMIPYTPEDLISIANKEFAWCDAEMLKASKEMGFGDNWKAAMEKIKNAYVPPSKQPEAMMKLYNESLDFIKKHNLITIPPLAEETWRMSMMAPERQLVSPFFLGGEEFIISYPTNTMQHDDKMMSMRGNNPHFSRATVHHELLAGHAMQQFMNDRYRSYRQFNTPFWTEGWALYWERLLWDLKFPVTPEDRMGMLFWRMHRCARIIFSLSYHTNKWTPQQCIDFLVDRVNHERANAEGEVRRSFTGGYGPLYQIAYMIGGLQFEALKKELVDGGKMTYQQFHDAIIRENAMPVEMVRALLLKQAPKKDFITNWKFYKL
ncbi:DUF885 family protein [Chitinophaga sp. SYP-B3965]|uniref:DUF885 family protein n=1 Tax=Chitinophaga sp. SYP-B3965 TaxID=2663120 RepID=UPI001299E820|nr:DUF885 family protein [Chitinophaga sp. SYP-B3965]MRG43742.1 DUF885 family protein [Chitinophaga sp. SYP-B3965]